MPPSSSRPVPYDSAPHSLPSRGLSYDTPFSLASRTALPEAQTPSRPAAGSLDRHPSRDSLSRRTSIASSTISSLTTIESDLDEMPDLEPASPGFGSDQGPSITGDSGHMRLASLNSSGHLDLSGISSGTATPAASDRQVDAEVEAAYSAAEQSISSSYWMHETFKSNYGKLKDAMSGAGGVDVDRLGALLAKEESVIRTNLGRSKWASLNMDYGVDSYRSSVISSTRDSTLSWIKNEQKSLGLPWKQSWQERLSSWASKALSGKRTQTDVPGI